jgi:hypothetical protein
MPVVVKLSPEEVRSELNKGKSQRQLVNEQYDAMLEGFEPSDWGEVQLDADEKRATVRNRLKSAADRRGLGIRFKRGQGNQMRFEIVVNGAEGGDNGAPASLGASASQAEPAADEPVSSVAPPASRRGRRPAVAEEPLVSTPKRRGRPKASA